MKPLASLLLTLSLTAAVVRAEQPRVPPPEPFAATLSLKDAVGRFRRRGLDLLMADAARLGAEANVQSAAATPNPRASFAVGPMFNYAVPTPCSGCVGYSAQWQLGDGGALLDRLSGKRAARTNAAQAALQVAMERRADVERILLSLVKQAYVQLSLAEATLEFQKAFRVSFQRTLAITRRRYPGVIDEGALARVEVQALGTEQAVTRADNDVLQARVALAFLLGARSPVPPFATDQSLRDFQVPASVAGETERSLRPRALARRPDRKAADASLLAANAQIETAKRNLFPTTSLSLSYASSALGQDGASPTYVAPGIETTLPLFYQGQGELRRSRAARDTAALSRAKTDAQVGSDLASAWAGFVGARAVLTSLDTRILPRAKTARDIVTVQFEQGATHLVDLLDAERTYLTVGTERATAVATAWTALFVLEQAVAEEFTP